MSFFDDQMDDWLANDCKGNPEDYDGCGGIGAWAEDKEPWTKKKGPAQLQSIYPSKTAKRRAQRKRASARKNEEGKVQA